MSCRRFISLGIALFLVLCVLHASTAASLNKRSHDLAEGRSLRSAVARAHRQANDDPADEESDEDDDEYDAEQAQQEIVRNQQAQEDSQEYSEEDNDDDDDDVRRRRRRDVPVEEVVTPVKVAEESVVAEVKPDEDKKDEIVEEEAAAIVALVPIIPIKKQPSVLILIRDALKKVTAELPQPTQQVATSALQYFQLFEHFLQQTIEQVIGDDDDDDEEATTVKAEVSEDKIPEAVEAPLPVVPAPATIVEEVAQVAQVTPEEMKPAVVPEQIEVPKKEVVVPEVVVVPGVVVPEVVASNKV